MQITFEVTLDYGEGGLSEGEPSPTEVAPSGVNQSKMKGEPGDG